MRFIEGLVCTVKFEDPGFEQLFGPNTGNSEFRHQPFITNGLKTFPDIEVAREALTGLKIRQPFLQCLSIGLAEIMMQITERNQREIDKLQTGNDFIVVAKKEKSVHLFGKPVDNIPGCAYAPVSDLLLNGFQTINEFSQALYALKEVERQGHIPAHLATFTLKRLEIS